MHSFQYRHIVTVSEIIEGGVGYFQTSQSSIPLVFQDSSLLGINRKDADRKTLIFFLTGANDPWIIPGSTSLRFSGIRTKGGLNKWSSFKLTLAQNLGTILF
jgi:hypothetical protein